MTEDWTRPAWRDSAVSWLDSRLAAAGLDRTGPVEQPRVRPWSTVLTAPTTAGRVWLKVPAPEMAFEAALYGVLHELVPERVLAPLATDVTRGWVLLPDGGPTLVDAPEELVEAMPVYAELQRRLAPHVPRLLDAGVADMRPADMPARFAEAVVAADLPPSGSGLPDDVAERVAGWAAELAASPVPASLDHNDLHPGNVLRSTGTTRFYDWGDSVVAHCFASALVPLDRLATRLGPEVARRARDAYLEVFTDLAPRDRLSADLALAHRLGKIARTLTWARAVRGSDRHADVPRSTLLSLLDEPPF